MRGQICYCSPCPSFFELPFPHSVWVQGRLGAPESCCWRCSYIGQKITGTELLIHELPSQTPLFSSIPTMVSPIPFPSFFFFFCPKGNNLAKFEWGFLTVATKGRKPCPEGQHPDQAPKSYNTIPCLKTKSNRVQGSKL